MTLQLQDRATLSCALSLEQTHSTPPSTISGSKDKHKFVQTHPASPLTPWSCLMLGSTAVKSLFPPPSSLDLSLPLVAWWTSSSRVKYCDSVYIYPQHMYNTCTMISISPPPVPPPTVTFSPPAPNFPGDSPVLNCMVQLDASVDEGVRVTVSWSGPIGAQFSVATCNEDLNAGVMSYTATTTVTTVVDGEYVCSATITPFSTSATASDTVSQMATIIVGMCIICECLFDIICTHVCTVNGYIVLNRHVRSMKCDNVSSSSCSLSPQKSVSNSPDHLCHIVLDPDPCRCCRELHSHLYLPGRLH